MRSPTTEPSAPDPGLDPLRSARYARLRTFRRDGTGVDTPIWLVVDRTGLLFRTKSGPKTRRITADPRIELTPCDYRGRVRSAAAPTFTGTATILQGREADEGNRALHERYGWQWNVIPLIKLPGVTNVHRTLSWRERWRRARSQALWPDSVIVRVAIDGAERQAPSPPP